jgi:hypothetical protein
MRRGTKRDGLVHATLRDDFQKEKEKKYFQKRGEKKVGSSS